MDVYTMEAGKELDALIAEDVLGWKKKSGVKYPAGMPLYSAYIGNAWEVVKAMRRCGYDVTVTAFPRLEYGCRIAPRGEINTSNVVFASAQTAPLAICRAALAMVRNDVSYALLTL